MLDGKLLNLVKTVKANFKFVKFDQYIEFHP